MPSYLSIFLAATSLAAAMAEFDDISDISQQNAGYVDLLEYNEIVMENEGNVTAGSDLMGSWTMYKQCDSRWAKQQLGTCSHTICSAGCAMSSAAMMLKTKGSNQDPSSLDKWLTKNGGYANGCNIYWGKVDAFGKTTYRGMQTANENEICNGLKKNHGIIANVNGGGHWVLLTGCKGGGVFTVNDPGYSKSTYKMKEILREAVYH